MTRATAISAPLLVCLAATGVLGPMPAHPSSGLEDLTTWIMTPTERDQALQRRRAAQASDVDAEARAFGTWQFQGLSRSSTGAASAWINGRLVRAGEAVEGGAVLDRIEPNAIWLRWEGRRHRLRVGEALASDHKVSDALSINVSKKPTLPAMAPK